MLGAPKITVANNLKNVKGLTLRADGTITKNFRANAQSLIMYLHQKQVIQIYFHVLHPSLILIGFVV